MRTRRASVSDLDAVAAIARGQSRSAGWGMRQFEEELGSARTAFFVLDETAVRGYAVFKVVAPEAQLVDLAVDASCLRKGLGRALLNEAFSLLRSDGFREVTLEVSESNEAARALYKALGFVVVGRRKKFYNDGSDAILMDLTLR